MFAKDAKDEIARVAFERRCCSKTFVRALLDIAGGSGETGTTGRLIRSARGAVIRAVLNAAHRANLSATAQPAALRYAWARCAPDQRSVPRRTAHLPKLGRWVVTLNASRPRVRSAAMGRKYCCRHAWLRAVFLSCGSVSDPAHGYHIEFYCRDDAGARLLCDRLAAFQIDAGLARRRGRPLVYLKDAQSVRDVLAHMGASRAALQVEAQRALRQTKNSIHRAVNCETANAARSATVAARQYKAAARALRGAGLASISAGLKEAAKLRIAHPAGTLAELARCARPPITKAAMAHRLRLLESVYKR